jgi:hypothetical protein
MNVTVVTLMREAHTLFVATPDLSPPPCGSEPLHSTQALQDYGGPRETYWYNTGNQTFNNKDAVVVTKAFTFQALAPL